MAYREPDTEKIIKCLVNLYNYKKEPLFNKKVLEMLNDINIHYKLMFVEFETKPSDLYPFINLYLCSSYLTFDQYMFFQQIAKDYVDVLISLAF